MEIYLNNGHAFPVPVAVADHLLGLASHDQLKVLLYVLCHANEPLTQEQVAKSCKVKPSAVEEALIFWQDANVLLTAPAVPAVGLQMAAAVPQAVPAQTAAPLPQEPAPVQSADSFQDNPQSLKTSSDRFHITPSEIANRIQNNPSIQELFQSAEQYASRLLNPTEQKLLIWMNEYLGMPPEMISVLLTFCAHIGEFNASYIEKIAIIWKTDGINTPELAIEDIERRTNFRAYTGQIRSMFEMHRKPTEYQQSFIDNWQRNGYSLELVRLAYEKTRNQADDKLSFPYINKILVSWAEKGIRTVAEAQKLDDAFYAQKSLKEKQRKSPANSKSQPRSKPEAADASFNLEDFDQLVNRF